MSTPHSSNSTSASAATALDALADRYWQRRLEYDYALRGQLGKPVDIIRPLTDAHADADAAFGRSVLDVLRTIDANALDHDRWLTYRTLCYLAENDVANRTYFWLRQEATPYAGGARITAIAKILTDFQFAGSSDAARYESLLLQYAAFVRSVRDLLQGQHWRGIVMPQAEIDASQAVFAAYAGAAASDALVPAESRLQSLTAAERRALGNAADSIATAEVIPAFASVAEYLAGPYRLGAPDGVGLWQYAGGEEYYRQLVAANATFAVTPEQLHAMGLDAVAELNAELDGIRREIGFHDDLRAFKSSLQSDRQFYVKTTTEFGDRLEAYVGRAAAAVPKYFARLPEAPYGVAPLPKELAEGQTFGYYDQPTAAKPRGTYLYNAWRPERTSALSAGALICHELIPGHHFQIALQQENAALPDVRHYDFSAVGFVEGWGEYASQLGWEMGVYETPYDKAGRIMQDLMVSTRLVVDTGMNALRWSRERAHDYMREHLTLSDAQIASETLRYSADIPGQALAYKAGELAFLQIRERATAQLGASFDIRQFHSWVLDSGSMTLHTLREHVDYEIARQKRAP